MQKSDKIVIISLAGVMAAVFAAWALTRTSASVAGMAAAAAAAALFACIALKTAPGALGAFRESEAPFVPESLRDQRRSVRHPWAKLVLWLVAYRVLLIIIAYVVYTLANGYQGGILDTLKTIWLRTDSPSYLGIAENWYVTEGDPRFHIVFFPLYPILIKGVWFIVRDYFASAMLVSNLCFVGAGVAFYELMALDMPRRDALRALKYLCIFPGAFFFGAPMTESLFLLLSVSALLLARKKRWLWACVAAALAGFTRSPGILLFVPIAYELALDLKRSRSALASPVKTVTLRALCLLIIPLGLIGYLLINYIVTGSAFTFAVYQREHWSQGLGWFFDTAAYQTDNMLFALNDGNLKNVWGLYLPNLICEFGSLIVVLKSAKRLRPSYALYFLACYLITIGATWLLSAPRYLAVCFPVAIALSELGKNRSADWALTVLCGAGLINYMAMYALGFPVY